MNAVNQLVAAENRLVAGIEAITATVNGIGTGRIDTAMGELLDAVQRARVRLDDALAGVEGTLAGLVRDIEQAAGSLEEGLPNEPEPQPVAQESAYDADAHDAEREAAATENPWPEEVSDATGPVVSAADGIDLSAAADGAQTEPVNRVAEAMGGAPSRNGHAGGGKGKRRRK